MVSVTISSTKKISSARGLPVSLEFPSKSFQEVTGADVKKALSAKFPKLSISRQRITLKGGKKPLDDRSALSDAGATEGTELVVKDLGPQVSWRTVYVVEYVGPLLIHPFFYNFPKLIYGKEFEHSLLQKFLISIITMYFIKRELESVFVHRFSHATMPLRNIFKNSAHYHLLGGLALAYPFYGPNYSASRLQNTIREDPRFLWACAALWAFGTLSNGKAHLTLRNLRPAGTTKRAIPHGYGFSLVSCPNYAFDCISWLAIAIMTGSWNAWIFLAISTGQMLIWALKKHRAYKKEFGKEYPRNRKVMIPFIY